MSAADGDKKKIVMEKLRGLRGEWEAQVHDVAEHSDMFTAMKAVR